MQYAAYCALLLSAFSVDGKAPDLTKLDRRLVKEPRYTAEQPLYCLAAFGADAQTRVWLVLDKSAADAEHYDVVYADLNADGNLTQPEERISAKPNPYGEVHFNLPDLTDAVTLDTHTELKLSVSNRNGPIHLVKLRWRGERQMAGGYPIEPAGGYMEFASTPEKAPIIWFNGDGPFRFQRWYSGEFTIGGADDLKLFLGLPGLGKNTFTAFREHVLPDNEPVHATLRYQDSDGSTHELALELTHRC